jgi:NAD(P)-dependent dehydrogenase (short-subunit alcohol dehydrogenase family)
VFTGASASVKGYAQSAPFAMGKFALRGLAQSMARELHPQGIHVAHIVIDGGIKSERRPEPPGKTASLLNPNSIAATYLHVIHQPHSAWSWEVELFAARRQDIVAAAKPFAAGGVFDPDQRAIERFVDDFWRRHHNWGVFHRLVKETKP